MDLDKKKLLEQLERLAGSEFEKVYEGALEGFAYYFSKLDIDGINNLLNDSNYYDGVSKQHYINLIEKAFNSLKSQGITSLLAVPGTCNGCVNGCCGYTFIHIESGIYVDIIIEIKKSEISNFMECYDLNNITHLNSKKQRIKIKSTKKS